MRLGGFPPVPLLTGNKATHRKGWPEVARRAPETAESVEDKYENTGFLCDGLQAVDIDVDDASTVAQVAAAAEQILGAPALVRSRPNSPRVALVYRAAEGTPQKQSRVGEHGKVEILGQGQQLHAFGLHPSGVPPEWTPAPPGDVRREDLRAIDGNQVREFLDAISPIIGAAAGSAKNPSAPARISNILVGTRPSMPPGNSFPDLNAAALRTPHITPAELEAACASIPDGYPGHPLGSGDVWRPEIMCPLADYAARNPEHEASTYDTFARHTRRIADPTLVAKHQAGAADYFNNAEQRYTREVKNRRAGLTRVDVATVGRLIQSALGNREAPGWGGRWDGRTAAHVAAAPGNAPAATTVVQPSIQRLAAALGASASPQPFFGQIPHGQANLHAVQWLVPGLLLTGEIAAIVGQGGSAKTALAIHLAVAAASGRQSVGPLRINTRPGGLRVAIISAEEDCNRIGLLVAAACGVLRLTAAERSLVQQNLLVHDAKASGWRLGEPLPGSRDSIAPEANDRALIEVRAALAQFKPDLLILDTLATLFALPSEIDNNAITVLMRRLSRAARDAGCAVLLLHHTPKMTRETAAAQRGEATLVRGGTAITNSARVVVTITSLPAAEAGVAAMQGLQPDQVRRLEHAKINDEQPMAPALFKVTSVQVTVNDGTGHAVRAVEFIPALPAAGGSIPDAIRNLAMKAVDAGARDDHGVRVPLSPGGGRGNQRDAAQMVAGAILNARPGMPDTHARAAAKEVLKDLERIGCVIEQDIHLPRYKASGQSDGTRKGRGLGTRWDLAPWTAAKAQQPAASGDADQIIPAPEPGQTSAPERSVTPSPAEA